jgi:ABC-type dipeptide/oligopeptide/nickel transport system permease component
MRALLFRAALLAMSLWFIVTIAFLAVYALPGDPARMILGQRATTETLETFRVQSGLRDSLPKQYLRFVTRTVNLDFGVSLAQRRPVLDLLKERSPVTALLVMCAVGVVCLFSFLVPLSLHSFRLDHTVSGLEKFWTGIASVPPYVCAVAALVVFAGWLKWVPILFETSRFKSWILPPLVLAAYPTGVVLRLFEHQLRSALGSQYSLRARSFGFRHRYVLFYEALPNALTPAIAALANGLAFFVTGTLFVEVAFGMPGLGGLTYEAVRNKDVPVLVAVCILFAFTITLISTALDMVLIALDPKSKKSHA